MENVLTAERTKMREVTTTTKVYKFDELCAEAKETAIQAYSDINVFGHWWESVFKDAATIGFKIIRFGLRDGGYCRGSWTKDAETVAALILENHGETHKDATAFLADLEQAQAGFDETHEYWELCREFKKTICEDYRIILEKEHDRLGSEEAIIETIKMNEWEFTVDGEKYEAA